MSFLGMDLEAAARHATSLQHRAVDELFNVIVEMEGLMPQLMEAWRGDDAQAFEEAWRSRHKSSLTQVMHALGDFRDELVSNVEAQRQASEGP